MCGGYETSFIARCLPSLTLNDLLLGPRPKSMDLAIDAHLVRLVLLQDDIMINQHVASWD